MYRRVLVPLDGSEVAMQALPYAAMLAKALSAKMALLEVVSPVPRELMDRASRQYEDGEPGYPQSAQQWDAVQAKGRQAAAKRLDDAAHPLRQSGLQVDTLVVENDPADGITQEASREPDTLIAISTHGRSGIGRWVLGSVTDKVVRLADGPVLVVRAHESPAQEPKIDRVILALDGSEASEKAVPHAAQIAKGLGVGITLLRSITPLVYGDAYVEYIPAWNDDLYQDVAKDVKDYLDKMAKRGRDEGVMSVRESAPDGYAASVVLDEVGAEGDKLVVMATHARSGVGRLVLGSVADRVVRHSTGPVLLVHPHGE